MTTAFNVNSAALDNASYERIWTQRRVGVALSVLLALAVCWHLDGVQLSLAFQPATFEALWSVLRGLFPPDLSPGFLKTVLHGLVTTVATAIAGTIISVLVALPLGALATPILWRRGILSAAANRNLIRPLESFASRAILALLGFLRAVPDLVWGLLFVTAVGLGSLAGALALAVAYTGVLGRVYADAFANVDPQPLEALQATGATRAQILLRGIWPQALPNLTAYTLYSFECCVRAASVLGFVGAGGIGYEISISMRLFEYGQVMTLILAFVILLALTDIVSKRVRASMRPNAGSIRRPPGIKRGRFVWHTSGYVIAGVAIVGSFYLAGFSLEHFGEANTVKNMLRFCRGMMTPDFAKEFVLSLGPLAMQTLAISVLGTLMGMAIGGILAIPATSTLVLMHSESPGNRSQIKRGLHWSVFWAARLVLNLLRSIPDLIWVLVCILVVGIGPFAGTLAIGLHTAGVLGKLYAETMEEVPAQPVEALRALGAGRLQLLAWALWPQAKRMLASYSVLRWETNIRASAILGLLGGGGLGQAIYNNVQLGFYSRLATLLLLVYLLVMVSDWIGDKVSSRSLGA